MHVEYKNAAQYVELYNLTNYVNFFSKKIILLKLVKRILLLQSNTDFKRNSVCTTMEIWQIITTREVREIQRTKFLHFEELFSRLLTALE